MAARTSRRYHCLPFRGQKTDFHYSVHATLLISEGEVISTCFLWFRTSSSLGSSTSTAVPRRASWLTASMFRRCFMEKGVTKRELTDRCYSVYIGSLPVPFLSPTNRWIATDFQRWILSRPYEQILWLMFLAPWKRWNVSTGIEFAC